MNMNTTLTIKTPKKLRDDAKKTAHEMGVPLTIVMNTMLKQFVHDRRLVLEAECPFPSHTPNTETRRAIRDIQQRKNLVSFDSVGEFQKHVRSLQTMRRTIWRRQCERDLKRMIERGKDREKFLNIAGFLETDGRVPVQNRPHKLSGEYEGLWECHIESDWLLIYDVTGEELLLARTGTHADLFE